MAEIQERHQREAIPRRDIRVVQFGEGNFLRAFVDEMLEAANDAEVFQGDVAVVKPTPRGGLERFKRQENLYTVVLRGLQNGETVRHSRLITCVQRALSPYEDYEGFLALAELPSVRFIVSNTTEAGIVFHEDDSFFSRPADTFPGKLTQFLYHRFRHFCGDVEKGVYLLPTELIEGNGLHLRECVRSYALLWKLGDTFLSWLDASCVFLDTLVDRIVTGFPVDEAEAFAQSLGYSDALLDVGEPFALWVIEKRGGIEEALPLHSAGLPVVYAEDIGPYRERKVRLLNGAHTSLALAGFLCGKETVLDCMGDPLLRRLVEAAVYQELVPTVPLPRQDAQHFADSVLERFANPYLRHSLLAISLNSISKWRARILPPLKDTLRNSGRLPKVLTFSFSALLAFYTGKSLQGEVLYGERDGVPYPVRDNQEVLRFFAETSGLKEENYVACSARQRDFWGEDITALPGFVEAAAQYLTWIRQEGMQDAIRRVLKLDGEE
jgi:tagaturonate reductase